VDRPGRHLVADRFGTGCARVPWTPRPRLPRRSDAAGDAGRRRPTYLGKCWPGSCALGPRFVSRDELGDDGALQIEMRINRNGQQIYRHSYNTARRKRDFREVPDLVMEHHRRYAPEPPPSKRVLLDGSGWLAAGTVIMLGTGIIVPQRAYCQPGDVVTISCPPIGELTNLVVAGAAVHG
jgi:2-keto-4-pentenoate hydratase/2-oxohepta-3-ene-1,7-dioic acid hydratase in catechol pathway